MMIGSDKTWPELPSFPSPGTPGEGKRSVGGGSAQQAITLQRCYARAASHPHTRLDISFGRRAFTFMEVLFAVMIMGIGMIMVAAMFPAALRQTQNNVEDATSATLTQMAYNTMQLYAYDKVPGTPPSGGPQTVAEDTLDGILAPIETSPVVGSPRVYSFHDQRADMGHSGTGALSSSGPLSSLLWRWVSANIVLPSNPQYAWVPLFSRSKINSTAITYNPNGTYPLEQSFRLFVIPVRCRNRAGGYIGTPNPGANTVTTPLTVASPLTSDIYIDASNDPSNLDPALVDVTIFPASATGVLPATPAYIQINDVCYGAGGITPMSLTGGINAQYNPVASGAYLVISDCTTNPLNNGSIYKVGNQVQGGTGVTSPGLGVGTTGEYWSLAPDNAASSAPSASYSAKALIVGRGPDTSSTAFQTWAASPASMQASPMPRSGPAQDIGIFVTVIALP